MENTKGYQIQKEVTFEMAVASHWRITRRHNQTLQSCTIRFSQTASAISMTLLPAVVSCRRKRNLKNSCPFMTMFTRFRG